jgi:hypothetical protein
MNIITTTKSTSEKALDIARGLAKKQFKYKTLQGIWIRQGGASFKEVGRMVERRLTPAQIDLVWTLFVGIDNGYGRKASGSIVFDILLNNL